MFKETAELLKPMTLETEARKFLNPSSLHIW